MQALTDSAAFWVLLFAVLIVVYMLPTLIGHRAPPGPNACARHLTTPGSQLNAPANPRGTIYDAPSSRNKIPAVA